MNDATKVREAAERLRNGEYVYEPRAVLFHFSRTRMNDVCELADAYLREHDETPLTVEGLVETVVQAGGKCSGDDAVRIGRLTFAICEIEVIVGVSIDGKHVPPELWPRTVGELRQLILRMEEQS